MKQYDEIKDIIVNKLGIKDLAAYQEWIKPFHNPPETRRLVTPEDIELLSPDNVHNGHFWKVVEELVGPDCVANSFNAKLTNAIDAGNQRNWSLARVTGMLNVADDWKHHHAPVLEIGAGYGNFKYHCMLNTAFKYMGIDAWPKISGVIPTKPDGTMPQEIIDACLSDEKNRVHLVYSSNVFQHLSRKQRSQYFKDIHTILEPDGCFIFNLLVHYDDPKSEKPLNLTSTDHRQYLKHYGQFTEIPFYPELQAELQQWFNIHYETRRYHDCFFTFVCSRKELTTPQVAATVVS